jgi:hypothetical protein
MSRVGNRRGQGLIEFLLLVLMLVSTVGQLLIGPFVGLPLLLPDLFGAASPTLMQIAGLVLLVAAATTLMSTLLIRLLRDRASQSRSDEEAAKLGSLSPRSLFITLLQLTVGVQLLARGSADAFGSLESTLIGAYLLYPIVAIPINLIRQRIKRGKTTGAE